MPPESPVSNSGASRRVPGRPKGGTPSSAGVKALSWDVELPSREQASLGGMRPRATLVIEAGTQREERLLVPRAVGKRLLVLKGSGGRTVASREELLFELHRTEESCCGLRAEWLVGRRDYSVGEMTDRLRRDGYSQSVVDNQIERYVESGVLDDARYADAFVRSRISCGWGARKIALELRRRGIDVDGLPAWPEEYFERDSEYRRALGLASMRSFSGRDPYAQVVRFLCTRGFDVGLAHRVARELVEG